VYSRDTGRGNSREGGGGARAVPSVHAVARKRPSAEKAPHVACRPRAPFEPFSAARARLVRQAARPPWPGPAGGGAQHF